ncbi:unnamed protein product [Brugia pahangi]|uniref:Interleukin-1 receptor type 2 n=1 Tax=Brugia pahangi TaxID=6280 RepID=A0A0N4T676_BRUPA|nr:unnamed protein product [Brugia pahangi]
MDYKLTEVHIYILKEDEMTIPDPVNLIGTPLGNTKTGSACQISKDNSCEVWEERKQRNCGTDSTQPTGSSHHHRHHHYHHL